MDLPLFVSTLSTTEDIGKKKSEKVLLGLSSYIELLFIALFLPILVTTTISCENEGLATLVCTPGELECLLSGGARVCSVDGTGWVEGACAEGEVCIEECNENETCESICAEQICIPGERFCGPDGAFIYTCNETGTSGCYEESCVSSAIGGVCSEGECIVACDEGLKSYIGCEYFAADLDNARVFCSGNPNGQFCDAAGSQFAIVVSNPDDSRNAFVQISKGFIEDTLQQEACGILGSVAAPDNFIETAVLPPQGIRIFELDRRDINGTVAASLTYRISSNVPITVYQFNPLENENVFSNDASMLIPTTSAGNQYLVMAREQLANRLRGFMTVVGIKEGGTEVTIRPTGYTSAGLDSRSGALIGAALPGDVLTFELDQFEVVNLQTDAFGTDLTGSLIEGDKPFLVFAGNEAANVPSRFSQCDLLTLTCQGHPDISCDCEGLAGCDPDDFCQDTGPCCADHLEQQMYPVSAWGRRYLAARSYRRGQERDTWRILASQDGTEVTLTPPIVAVPQLDAGEWFEFEAAWSAEDGRIVEDFLIDSNKPVLVGQFLAGEQSRGAAVGDPAFILTVPQRQFREDYSFLAPNKYELDFVTVVLRDLATASLDGASLATMASELVGIVETEEIADSGWTAFRAPISDGFHRLDCPGGCGVMVHGYDQYVSYGYPGGLNFFECQENEDCPAERPVCNDSVCIP